MLLLFIHIALPGPAPALVIKRQCFYRFTLLSLPDLKGHVLFNGDSPVGMPMTATPQAVTLFGDRFFVAPVL